MMASVPRPALANWPANASANRAGETALTSSVSRQSARSCSHWLCSGSMPWAIITMSIGGLEVSTASRPIAAASRKSVSTTAMVDAGLRTARSAAMRPALALSRATSTRSQGWRATHSRQQCSAIAEVAPMTTILMPYPFLASHQPTRHCRAHARVAIGRKLAEPRIALLEHRSRHAGILCRVEPAAGGRDNGVEPLEQRLDAGAVREIERQCHARPREAQQARRPAVAERLQHRQHRALARAGDHAQHLGDCGAPGLARHHTLVLVEAGRAIHAVPGADGVERKQERLIVD